MVRLERIPTTSRNQSPSIQPTAVPPPNLLPRTITRTRRLPRQFAFFPYPASLVLQHATPAMVMAATKVRPATFPARVSSPAFRHPTPRSSTHLAIIPEVRFCASGGWCAPDNVTGEARCHRVCCDDSECGTPGTKCIGIFTDPNIGSLGLCRIPTEDDEDDEDASNCLPPGASCSPSDDQCCGYCHVGHCH